MCSSETAYIAEYIGQSLAAMQQFTSDQSAHALLARMAEATSRAMKAGRKLLIAGNGGSAADSQHIAGEFISRLMYDRTPLPAIALTTDSSALTATANDYGYEHVFDRQVLGLGHAGDVLLGISTSGNSANVLRALRTARSRGLVTLGFTGRDAGPMRALCDLVLEVDAPSTPLVQQIHIVAAHIYCALVERALCPQQAA